MFGMTSIWHWIVVLVIVMIIFGPGKLPQIGEGLGKGIRNFKKSMEESGKEVETEKTEKLSGPEANPKS
ncbi:twin-arginine translocase TatA/TatE family subunit [Desulfatirhabdium butyrativorans]|uniref:twin-arginine translocase TatA/TatE family subunit n=1 Tax=Desulfatirhabdium butyrativorans TaxID=340467 RepID=UPI0004212415|nr:twin-arginine translocase TatA/TatE family subunit [Desulfatirhabdium butyrativorans]